jgi:hypothetical protein
VLAKSPYSNGGFSGKISQITDLLNPGLAIGSQKYLSHNLPITITIRTITSHPITSRFGLDKNPRTSHHNMEIIVIKPSSRHLSIPIPAISPPSYPVVMNASVAPLRMPRLNRCPCSERCTNRRRGALAKRSPTALGIVAKAWQISW